jgi:hypothetical protein
MKDITGRCKALSPSFSAPPLSTDVISLDMADEGCFNRDMPPSGIQRYNKS